MSGNVVLAALFLAGHSSPTVHDSGESAYGVTEVHASREAVYAALTSYEAWPSWLSDVTHSAIRSGSGREAVVLLTSKALGVDHAHAFAFNNVLEQEVRFRMTDGHLGTTVLGSYVLVDAGPGLTRVHVTLATDAGVLDWFVSDAEEQRRRRTKVLSDLTDLAKTFTAIEGSHP